MNALRPVVALPWKVMRQMVAYLALHDVRYAKHIIIIPFLYFDPGPQIRCVTRRVQRPKEKKCHGRIRRFCSHLMFTRSNRVHSQPLFTLAHALIGLAWNVTIHVNTLLEQDKEETINKQARPFLQALRRSSHFV